MTRAQSWPCGNFRAVRSVDPECQPKSHFCIGYFVVSALSSIVFRTVRDAVPTNPALQERLIGASLLALGIADVGRTFAMETIR